MQYGFGKLILFGEHFVVYGLPGIASAIDLYTRARIFPAERGIEATDALVGRHIIFGEKKGDLLDRALGIILGETGLKEKNFRLEIDGNIPTFGGLGSSACLVVAITRELNEYFSLGLNDERINEIAFKTEHVFHATPSGIDNTVSTFRGLVWFEKNMQGGKNTVELLKAKKPLLVVIGNTKISRDTGTVVKEVRGRKEKEPKKFEKIFAEAKELAFEARKALVDGNDEKVGELANKNHKLLQQIGVSSKELDQLCEIALQNGALGAKLTGAGKGGCMFAICRDKKQQEKIKHEFEKQDFEGYITKVGV